MVRHIVYINLVVSFSAGALTTGYCDLAQINNGLIYGLVTFFCTFSVYNGQRIFKASAANPTPWLNWVIKNKSAIIAVAIVSAIIASVFLILIVNPLNVKSIGLLGLVTIISGMYVVRVNGINLREIPFLKIHLIAFSWTALIVIFPRLNEMQTDRMMTDAFTTYFLIVGATIPFDIRDLKYDMKSQKTIPQLVGVQSSKIVAVIAVIISLSILAYNYPSLINIVAILAYLTLLVLIICMHEKTSDVYCAGLIDGALGLIGLSYFF